MEIGPPWSGVQEDRRVLREFCGGSAGVLREDSKFVCNVTVFRSTCSKWRGLEFGRAGSEDLRSPQLFQVGVTVCH